jgi:ATP-dependent DNA helicase DinG
LSNPASSLPPLPLLIKIPLSLRLCGSISHLLESLNMRGELIALDLETTGTDPRKDAILEIAAVRLRDGAIVDEFSTLVDPQRPIPPFITQLTGITDDEVQGKPTINAALPHLIAFAGNLPIIAHSIGFDTGFLYHHGALKNNLRLDTHEIASVLLPNARRYALGAVAEAFDIPLEHAHRALDDTRATALVYWRLWQKALTLPRAVLAAIVAAAQDFQWDAKPFFEAALAEGNDSVQGSGFKVLSTLPTNVPTQNSELRTQNLEQIFLPNGALSRVPAYEYREGQAQMAAAVDTALRDGKQVMIEAATGIGKTYAYLAPALRHAAATGERIVISTSTLTLQAQLMNKDIPTLADALGIQAPAAVMKGRGNYLCLRRYAALRERGASTSDELGLLAKLIVWEAEGGSGEKQDINLRGEEHNLWARLSAEDENCTELTCESIGALCPFYHARKAAQAARLLVVNHALLVADASSDEGVLPEYSALIIDEAGQLEDAVTNGMSARLDPQALAARLNEVVHDGRGLLPTILRTLRPALTPQQLKKYEDYAALTRQAAKATQTHIHALNGALLSLLDELRAEKGEGTYQYRVTADMRAKTAFEQAGAAWRTLEEFADAVSSALAQFGKALRGIETIDARTRGDLARAADAASRYFREAGAGFATFFGGDANTIYWLTSGWDERGVVIHAAPAHVGSILDAAIWSQKRAVVLTGATLQTNQAFDFVRERLGAPTMEALAIHSPFDFHSAVLHYVINDLPDTNDRAKHQNAVERAIIELATALDGRLLVLFTSLAQLRQTSSAVTPRLALGNIAVYDQLDSGGRNAVEGFSIAPRAVLMGTRSFWEGIDLPADTLRGVMIVRLPFSVPSDPVFAARSEGYRAAFDEYSVPEALLRFRQGFGRLIRRSTDRGVFVVMDGRLIGKSYGRSFLEALPDVTRQNGELSGLGLAAKAWIEKA